MKKKIIGILIYVGICLAGANVLFIIFDSLTNKPYTFNWFSCILVPIVLGVFTYVIMDKSANEYSIDDLKQRNKKTLADELEEYDDSVEDEYEDDEHEDDEQEEASNIKIKNIDDILDFDEGKEEDE